MTDKELVLASISELPDNVSAADIAERVAFIAAVQKGLDEIDRGETIPHDEVKREIASWLTN